jgi:hypothetical protein
MLIVDDNSPDGEDFFREPRVTARLEDASKVSGLRSGRRCRFGASYRRAHDCQSSSIRPDLPPLRSAPSVTGGIEQVSIGFTDLSPQHTLRDRPPLEFLLNPTGYAAVVPYSRWRPPPDWPPEWQAVRQLQLVEARVKGSAHGHIRLHTEATIGAPTVPYKCDFSSIAPRRITVTSFERRADVGSRPIVWVSEAARRYRRHDGWPPLEAQFGVVNIPFQVMWYPKVRCPWFLQSTDRDSWR